MNIISTACRTAVGISAMREGPTEATIVAIPGGKAAKGGDH